MSKIFRMDKQLADNTQKIAELSEKDKVSTFDSCLFLTDFDKTSETWIVMNTNFRSVNCHILLTNVQMSNSKFLKDLKLILVLFYRSIFMPEQRNPNKIQASKFHGIPQEAITLFSKYTYNYIKTTVGEVPSFTVYSNKCNELLTQCCHEADREDKRSPELPRRYSIMDDESYKRFYLLV